MNKLLLALTLSGLVTLVAAAAWCLPRGYAAARLLLAQDDPVALSDIALETTFDASVATREIEAALAANDVELAQSLLALARARKVTIDPALVGKIEAASGAAAANTRTVGQFARGFVTGVPNDGASLAGTALGDLFVFGDLRDAARESWRALQGEQADHLVLAFAAAGLAITAGTYASLGAAAPARIGLTVAKAAGRTGRVSAKLVKAIRLERADGLVRLAGDVGRVQSKAGTRAALDGLRLVETPQETARLARLAEAKGPKTRALLKVLGRGAIVLATSLFDLAWWVFWALVNIIGLIAAFKRLVERSTMRFLRRQRDRAMRARALARGPLAG